MATIQATLVINTKKLASNPSDVAAACLLYDSNLDPEGTSAKDFTINAKAGDNVIFHVCAKDNVTPVCFYQFGQESGGDTFSPFPSYPNWKGTVDQSGAYYIKFMVPSIQDSSFKLDPAIDVKN